MCLRNYKVVEPRSVYDATLAGIAVRARRGAAWFLRAETNMVRVKLGRKKCVYSQQRHKKRH